MDSEFKWKRLVWSRTYLKNYGLVENMSRDVWALSKIENKAITVNPLKVVQKLREGFKQEKRAKFTF